MLTIWDFYSEVKNLRSALSNTGRPDLSQQLFDAERGATTSGEALSNIGALLKRWDDVKLDPNVRAQMKNVEDLGLALAQHRR